MVRLLVALDCARVYSTEKVLRSATVHEAWPGMPFETCSLVTEVRVQQTAHAAAGAILRMARTATDSWHPRARPLLTPAAPGS